MSGWEFFEQLQEFSERYIAQVGIVESISPWGRADYDEGGPFGAIIHYTADEDFDRVLKWFLQERYQARVSAHVVVGDTKMPGHDECVRGLPLIQELPVTVVQIREHDTVAWHARGYNGITYSIENICAGELRLGEDDWVTVRRREVSAPEWTAPWQPRIRKKPINLYGRWWSPYTEGQIVANIQILRYLNEIYPLQPEWILGHDGVSGDKRDPGPAYPIHDVRSEVFSDALFEKSVWFKLFTNDFLYGLTWRDAELRNWARWLYGADQEVWSMGYIESRFRSFMADYRHSSYLGVPGTICLKLLGYYVPYGPEAYLDADTLISMEIFRRMVGLERARSSVLPEALVSRLHDRGIIK